MKAIKIILEMKEINNIKNNLKNFRERSNQTSPPNKFSSNFVTLDRESLCTPAFNSKILREGSYQIFSENSNFVGEEGNYQILLRNSTQFLKNLKGTSILSSLENIKFPRIGTLANITNNNEKKIHT